MPRLSQKAAAARRKEDDAVLAVLDAADAKKEAQVAEKAAADAIVKAKGQSEMQLKRRLAAGIMPRGPPLATNGKAPESAVMQTHLDKRIAALCGHYGPVIPPDGTFPKALPRPTRDQLVALEAEWRAERSLPALQCDTVASESPDDGAFRYRAQVLPALGHNRVARFRKQPSCGVDAETDEIIEEIRTAVQQGDGKTEEETAAVEAEKAKALELAMARLFYGFKAHPPSDFPAMSESAKAFTMSQIMQLQTYGSYASWLFFTDSILTPAAIPVVQVSFSAPHHDPFVAAYRTAARTHERSDAAIVFRMIVERGTSHAPSTVEDIQLKGPQLCTLSPVEIAVQLKRELRFPGSLLTGPSPGTTYVPNEDAMMQLHLQRAMGAPYVMRALSVEHEVDGGELRAPIVFEDDSLAAEMREHFKGAMRTGAAHHVVALLNIGSQGAIKELGRPPLTRHALAKQLLREFGVDLPLPAVAEDEASKLTPLPWKEPEEMLDHMEAKGDIQRPTEAAASEAKE